MGSVLARVENTSGNVESTFYHHFPLFSYFNPFPQCYLMMPLGNKPFENTVGKGEIARN